MKAKLIFLTAVFLPSLAIASGSSGGFGGSTGSFSTPAPQPVDQAYEYGKALYNGRTDEVAKMSYCVKGEEDGVKVKSSSLRPFKGSTYDELAKNLYNCDNPEQDLLAVADTDQATYIVYYLDERYNLDLQ